MCCIYCWRWWDGRWGWKQGRGKKLLQLTLLLILQTKLDRVWVCCVEGKLKIWGRWEHEDKNTRELESWIWSQSWGGRGKWGYKQKKEACFCWAVLLVAFSLPSVVPPAQSVLGVGEMWKHVCALRVKLVKKAPPSHTTSIHHSICIPRWLVMFYCF